MSKISEKTKVVIIEESPIFRSRLLKLVAGTVTLATIAVASNIPEGKRDIKRLKPDVIIVDIPVFQRETFDFLKKTKTEYPRTFVIVLSTTSLPGLYQKCLAAGADEFLQKDKELGKIKTLLNEEMVSHTKGVV